MIVYRKSVKEFIEDINLKDIISILKNAFYNKHVYINNESEYKAWKASLAEIASVLDTSSINPDLEVTVEYQIQKTSKRIDFIISGEDDYSNKHIVLIELKQWEQALKTGRDDIVITFLSGMNRAVAHPSYQVWSYAKLLEYYNVFIQTENIKLHPCVYLHNYKKSKLGELIHDDSRYLTENAPIFIKHDIRKFREWITTYLKQPCKNSLIRKIDLSENRPSKSLQYSIVNMIEGNEEFLMLDEQKVLFETINKIVQSAHDKNEKHTIIIFGGPGTGKSVLAVQSLVKLTGKGYKAEYVTKNAAPRNVYCKLLTENDYKKSYINALFKSSGSYVRSRYNEYDCLLIDESHRLNEKSGFYRNQGENQIKEIINSSRVNVFFIDESQIVTAKDIGSIASIEEWAKKANSKVYPIAESGLYSQFRCNGSDEYIAFIRDILNIEKNPVPNNSRINYDFKLYDNPIKMREDLRIKNNFNNKSRMVAGYCYEWNTKNSNDPALYDIDMKNGFKARWNFNSTDTWAIDPDSFDQVGCIHTAQGLEFEYMGVIIGKDLRMENGKIMTDPSKRAKSDRSLYGINKRKDISADQIIRNTYYTLLTRGEKGCYVYCEDSSLQEYFKNLSLELFII